MFLFTTAARSRCTEGNFRNFAVSDQIFQVEFYDLIPMQDPHTIQFPLIPNCFSLLLRNITGFSDDFILTFNTNAFGKFVVFCDADNGIFYPRKRQQIFRRSLLRNKNLLYGPFPATRFHLRNRKIHIMQDDPSLHIFLRAFCVEYVFPNSYNFRSVFFLFRLCAITSSPVCSKAGRMILRSALRLLIIFTVRCSMFLIIIFAVR